MEQRRWCGRDVWVQRHSAKWPNTKGVPQYIVGDPAFALHENLLKRYPGLHLKPPEGRYNWRQSRARMVAESLYGRMKGKWNVLINPMPFWDLQIINLIIKTCVLLHNFLLATLHPRHHFQYADYRRLMATLESAREKALEETNKSRKRKRAELTAKEKRDVVAKALDYDLSEENCVLFLGM